MEDTIAAISTPATNESEDGAIGIIRISGPDAFPIAARIFRGKKPFDAIRPYAVGYGSICGDTGADTGADADAVRGGTPDTGARGPFGADGGAGGCADSCAGGAIDEVLILKMRAPKSYTCEDVVEIHCHAGAGVQRKILRMILKAGARAAGPGEFTKRAFMNGRIDLAQAEAVMDLIRAKSEAGASAAMRQLEGALSGRLGAARESIVGLIASLEAMLDFPEHDINERGIQDIDDELNTIEQGLCGLADSFEYGRAAREGITAVIIGRPNVGKSTLLNLLAGRERAIVTDTPGTTRDMIDEYVNLGGFTVRFIDTAGIRDTGDAVEQIGVARAIDAIGQADMAIVMFAADEWFSAGDEKLMDLTSTKKRVFIINKTDLAGAGQAGKMRDAIDERLAGQAAPRVQSDADEIIEASLISGEGLPRIENAVKVLFTGKPVPGRNDVTITNARHHAAVLRGLAAIRGARRALAGRLPLEMPIIDMREALGAVGEITGETYSEDIIDRIFSEFCVGK